MEVTVAMQFSTASSFFCNRKQQQHIYHHHHHHHHHHHQLHSQISRLLQQQQSHLGFMYLLGDSLASVLLSLLRLFVRSFLLHSSFTSSSLLLLAVRRFSGEHCCGDFLFTRPTPTTDLNSISCSTLVHLLCRSRGRSVFKTIQF